MRFYVGTFTNGFQGADIAKGLYVFDLDTRTGLIEHLHTIDELHSPSFLARHPRLPLLYAVEREWSVEEQTTGALSTFAIDAAAPPRLVDRRRSGGDYPSHVALSRSADHLFVTNARGGVVSLFFLAQRRDRERGTGQRAIDRQGIAGEAIGALAA